MNDRELLELAAKAAGFNIDFADYRDLGSHTVYRKRDEYLTWWNPLADDGDALRLAVKLDLLTDLRTYSYEPDEWRIDPYAATRRAIVRAAAEIGRMTR